MNTEDFWKSTEITTFEKLVFMFLQFNEISTAKELAAVFGTSEITAKRALSNLKKAGLIKKGIKNDTLENEESIKIDTLLDQKVSEMILNYQKGIKNDTFSEKNTHTIYSINNLINIYSINKDGQLSLTSFASAVLKYFIKKFSFVNDPDHKELNSVHNSLTPIKTEKTSLAEIVKAPAKRTRAKSQFNPPTTEQVKEYMELFKAEQIHEQSNLKFFNSSIEAAKFIDYFEDKEWGWGRKKMKDWKRAVRNWVRGFKDTGTTKRRKNQDAIEEIFGKGLEPETNIIDAVQTENADGSVLYDASSSNQITAQPAEEAELSADEYIRRFKKGEIK